MVVVRIGAYVALAAILDRSLSAAGMTAGNALSYLVSAVISLSVPRRRIGRLNLGKVLTAAAFAAVPAWFDLFLTEPYGRFTITASTDIITAVLLLVVALAVSQLAARARRLYLVTVTDADHLTQIQQHRASTKIAIGRFGC